VTQLVSLCSAVPSDTLSLLITPKLEEQSGTKRLSGSGKQHLLHLQPTPQFTGRHYRAGEFTSRTIQEEGQIKKTCKNSANLVNISLTRLNRCSRFQTGGTDVPGLYTNLFLPI